MFEAMAGHSKAELDEALSNAALANEAFVRSRNYVEGWLNFGADTKTGLLRRNLSSSNYWNGRDAAADNYPFMVLTSFFTDKTLFEGRMKDMLATEKRLTSRIGACPDDYDFEKQSFRTPKPNVPEIIFGSCEYLKDGLIPLTEWLGPSPWFERMKEILCDLKPLAPDVQSIRKHWDIIHTQELSGDLLQILSRLYWMDNKNEAYLDWAIKIADVFLLEGVAKNDEFKLLKSDSLRLRDHGCEIVNGLCELYATLSFARPEKKAQYKKPLYEILDRILEVGRNSDGLFYDHINPKEGSVINPRLADTWGYILDAYYTVWQIDAHEPYRTAVLKVLNILNEKYLAYDWEPTNERFPRGVNLPENYKKSPWKTSNHDGYADSIESAINMYNRENVPAAAKWIDSQIKIHWAYQQPCGIIEGWHGDGNFARTAIMYALWKTQGTYLDNWRKDLQLGAVKRADESLLIVVCSLESWEGRLYFDFHRYKENMKLPLDWARINQFQQWFAVENDKEYSIIIDGKESKFSGKELKEGIMLKLGRRAISVIEVRY